MKTFKEQLTEKANSRTWDISEDIEIIKRKMEACVDYREFSITLIESKNQGTIVFGSSSSNSYSTFIPRGCEPHIYMKLFTVALKELGFKDEDITKGAGESKDFYSYSISVKW